MRMETAAILILSALFSNEPSMSRQQPSLRHVTIVATDYAYVVPASVPAGLTAFRFVNRGAHAHEVQLFRFKRGLSAQQARTYLTRGPVPDSVADPSGSVLIAFAGVTAHEEVLVQLMSGEQYALICGFRDAPTKPRHASLGMVALLEVR
jgi:hypothetical protein